MKIVTDALKHDRFYNFIDKPVTTTQFSRKTLGSGLIGNDNVLISVDDNV